MKYLMLLMTSVCLFSGCGLDRMVAISVPPIGLPASESNRIAPTNAVALFREVAAQFGFEIRGPTREPANYGTVLSYTALPGRMSSVNNVDLEVFIAGQTTVFQCIANDFTTARAMASQFERALDKQGVHYSVSEATASPLNN